MKGITLFALSIFLIIHISLARTRSHSHIGDSFENMQREEVKTLWTELNLVNVDEAVQQIKTERPELQVVKVKEGSMVTMDYRLNRVRVYYDESGRVSSPPKVG